MLFFFSLLCFFFFFFSSPIVYLCYCAFHFQNRPTLVTCQLRLLSDYTHITLAPSLVKNHSYYLIKEIRLEERLLLEPHRFVYYTLQFDTSSGPLQQPPTGRMEMSTESTKLIYVGYSRYTSKTSADHSSYTSRHSSCWQPRIVA